MESVEPIFDMGSGPGTEHGDDPNNEEADEARRIRERWTKEAHESPRADAAD